MAELWGVSHEEDTHYLRILVKKLRTKIGDSALTPSYIFTILFEIWIALFQKEM